MLRASPLPLSTSGIRTATLFPILLARRLYSMEHVGAFNPHGDLVHFISHGVSACMVHLVEEELPLVSV